MLITTLAVLVVVGAFVVQAAVLRPTRDDLRMPAVGRLVAGLRRRPDRWLLLALVVGFVLRLVWATWATRDPGEGSDAWEYLRTANDLADGILPRFDGQASAHYAPGYPALLVPLIWFSDLTGISSPLFLASLLNVVAGTSTVLTTAYLADRWISPRCRDVAAWAMALAPAQLYYTSTQHAETVHTALVLAAACALTAVLQRHPDGATRRNRLLALGVLVGFAAIVRTPGVVLLLFVLLAAHRIDGGWRTGARAVLWVGLGALVVLVPVTVRNGVQVDVWSPANTSNAVGLCLGNHPDGDASFDATLLTPEVAEDCYRGSPYDNPARADRIPPQFDFELRGVHEAEWYRETTRRSIGYLVGDPVETLTRGGEKLLVMYRDDSDALPGASNFSPGVDADRWAGSLQDPLALLADLWLWAVLLLAVVGLVLVPACRRASPVWAVPAAVTGIVLLGTSYPHYRHLAIPFLVVLAAGGALAVWDRVRAGAVARPILEPTSA